MSRYFQHIRRLLMAEGRLSKYLAYAIGEIVLVMIGILMALQVNNWNLDRLDKKRETKFLNNIVLDLNKDLVRLAYLIDFRKGLISGNQQLIAMINGQPMTDISELTRYVVNTLMEERFTPNNNTYRELSSSGNLNLITNDSIKLLLLELEERYKTNNFSIDHEAFDYREYISKPLNKHVDLDKMMPVYAGEKKAEDQGISLADFSGLFRCPEYKNGLYIMSVISGDMISIYQDMEARSRQLIKIIEKDLAQ